MYKLSLFVCMFIMTGCLERIPKVNQDESQVAESLIPGEAEVVKPSETNILNPMVELEEVTPSPVTSSNETFTIRSGSVNQFINEVESTNYITSIEFGTDYLDFLSEGEELFMYRLRFTGGDFLGEAYASITCRGPQYGRWDYDYNSYNITIAHSEIEDGVTVYFDFVNAVGDFFTGSFDVVQD